MALSKGLLLKYYKQNEIQERMIEHAKDKEVGVRYEDAFGKRPDILDYPKEVISLAMDGATSFHCSEERWSNPTQLTSELRKDELDEMREGWDLVLDIDCKILDYSKICADLVIKFLKYCGVKAVSCKFSVTGDTPILVNFDGKVGLFPIKEVIEFLKNNKEGKVLSLDLFGNVCYSKIKGYLEHKERIYEIYHENSMLPIKATKHHSVFVWSEGEIIQKEVEKLNQNDYLITFRNSNKLERKRGYFEWDYFYFKKKTKSKIRINHKLMLLLGYYLAEGHITKTIHQIGFSFNSGEKDYIDECISLLKEITGKKISIRNPNPNSTQIIIHSKEWYYFFEKTCGKGAKNKHVPRFVWTLPREYFEKLLLGYIRGDGYKLGEYSITIKSVSHQLIKEWIWLCKLNDISCSLNQEHSKEHFLPQGTFFKGSHIYSINLPKSELANFEFFRARNKFSPHPKGKTFPLDGLKKVYYQIKPKMFNHHRAEQMTLKKRSANLVRIKKTLEWFDKHKSREYSLESKKIVENYQKLFSNDLMALKVKKIVLSEEQDVYDISVENTERFFGGDYPILLHNSGNKGFHIGVPFEAFPKKIKEIETRLLFPEAPKKIALYIKENIKEELGRRVLELEEGDISKIKEKTGLDKEIIRQEKNEFGDEVSKLDVEPFLEIDTILISSRHLYRMPYSLHEKSGLSSVVINPDSVMQFEKKMAMPGKFEFGEFKFLDREVEESGGRLLLQALDFEVKTDQVDYQEEEFKGEEIQIESAIREELFPPCMKKMLDGLEDGRKRAVFCLINFLGKVGWTGKEIESYLLKWNREKNKPPLREIYIKSQLRYFKAGDKLPPNCANEAYYKAMGAKCDEPLCRKLKNPVNYTIRRWKWELRNKEEKEE